MLRGTPEDIRSNTGSLLVSSALLDLTQVSTLCTVISCDQRLRLSSYGPKDAERFIQGLMYTYSVKIYLSLMAD